MAPPPSTLVGAAMRDAVATGDLARAAELQRLVSIFPAKWSGRHGLAPTMKAAMAAFGLPLGHPAPPYAPLPPDEAQAVTDVVGAWPALDGQPARP